MTLANLRTYVRYLTGTDSASYIDADLDFNVNRALHTFNSVILSAIDGWSETETTTTINTVATTPSYAFPSNFIKIKRIEIDYTGDGLFVNAAFFDINETSEGSSATQIASNFSETKPFVDISDKIYTYPIPQTGVTGGIKVWYEPDPTELSADSDEATLIESFQPLIAYSVCIDYFIKTGQQEKADGMQTKLEKMLASAKDFYGRRIDQPVVMKTSSSLDNYSTV